MPSQTTVQKVIILFGPPGCGKGTQAELLAKKFYFYYLESSKVLEEKFKSGRNGNGFIEVDGEKFSVAEEAKNWRDGILCNPKFVAQLMRDRIDEVFAMKKSLILVGSPRTLYEGQQVMPFLEDKFGKDNVYILWLDLSPEQTIIRNTNRRTCELMRHPILYIPENLNLKRCPLDGSRIMKREDDGDTEVIKVRLKEYEQRTFPLMEYFKERHHSIKRINADQYVENVLKDILDALGDGFKDYEL